MTWLFVSKFKFKSINSQFLRSIFKTFAICTTSCANFVSFAFDSRSKNTPNSARFLKKIELFEKLFANKTKQNKFYLYCQFLRQQSRINLFRNRNQSKIKDEFAQTVNWFHSNISWIWKKHTYFCQQNIGQHSTSCVHLQIMLYAQYDCWNQAIQLINCCATNNFGNLNRNIQKRPIH